MKDNTQQTKHLLEQALRSLPGDYALQGARSHIVAAINQVLDVERKRDRRENTQAAVRKMAEDRASMTAMGYQPWQGYIMTLPQARAAISNLDKMIQGELGKIDEIKKAKPATNQGGSGTILG